MTNPVHARRTRLCAADEIEPGTARNFTVNGRKVVVVRNLEGEYFALRSMCPHQGAELGLGILDGTMLQSDVGQYCFGRQAEILRCPWHRWEFDVRDGRSLHDPDGVRVKSHTVHLVDGFIEIA